MIEIVTDRREKLAQLFPNHFGGYMGDAILDGYMGRALADAESPTCGVLELADVQIAILGGDLSHASVLEYLKNLSGIWALFMVSEEFAQVTKRIHVGKWVEMERYAFSTENLSIPTLEQLKAQLPDGFQVKKIDLSLAKQLAEDKQNAFADYHGKAFKSPEDFVERGVGFCICEGETIACVASSFAVSDKSIEIQIDTRRSYRGKHLATVAAAYLIVYCLEHGLDPGWDAATKISAKLAEKLGYTPQGTYKMYVFTDSRGLVILRKVVRSIVLPIRKLMGHSDS